MGAKLNRITPSDTIRSYTVESCSAAASCHVLVEQSEAQRNMHVGVVHVDDFESLPASESDDLHSGQDLHFGPFRSSARLQLGPHINDVHIQLLCGQTVLLGTDRLHES